MYKVMIVEDEVIVRVGLRNMINWSDINMTVVGEAQNGKVGLQMYHETKPNIILTDIKMPVMNGLEMIESIRKEDTSTRIVVLTSYDEFELVRQAFQLGISDYVLKLEVFPEDLQRVMLNVLRELLQQGEEGLRDVKKDRRQDLEGLLRDYLIEGACTCEEFETLADGFGFQQRGLVAGVLELEEENGQHSALILDLVKNMLREKNRGEILSMEDGRYLLVFCFGDRDIQTEREELLLQFVGRMQSAIQNYIGVKARFGLSCFADSYEELPELYREAVEAEDEAAFLGETQLVYESMGIREQYESLLTEFGNQLLQQDWLSDNSRMKILHELSKIRKTMMVNVNTLREYFIRWIHWVSYDCVIQRESVIDLTMEAAEQIRRAKSLRRLMEIYGKYAQMIMHIQEAKKVGPEVERAISYAKEHYRESNIDIGALAELLNLNKDYFSSRFKKETGLGFVDYVNELRIRSARELLRTTCLKSYEVAYQVGFKDEKYFARVFKKKTGIRPADYKRRELRSEDEGLQDEE